MNYLKDVTEALPRSFSQAEFPKIKSDAAALDTDKKPLVLIVDDMTLERECLAQELRACTPSFDAITQESHADFRIEEQPDVILVAVDTIDIGDPDVPKTIRALQSLVQDTPIVVLAEDAEATTVKAGLFNLGVSGCLSYSDGIQGLAQVLWLVIHGGACFPRESIRNGQQESQSDFGRKSCQPNSLEPTADDEKSLPDIDLTNRECDVVHQLRMGKPNKIIAYELGISISTVKVHVRNIMRKTGATNRVEAALLPEDRVVRPNRSQEIR